MDDNQWHLDKRVPIALILTLFVQAMGFMWWMGTLDTTVAEMRRDITLMQRNQVSAQEKFAGLIRVETKLDTLSVTIKEMNREHRQSIRRLWDETRKKQDKKSVRRSK